MQSAESALKRGNRLVTLSSRTGKVIGRRRRRLDLGRASSCPRRRSDLKVAPPSARQSQPARPHNTRINHFGFWLPTHCHVLRLIPQSGTQSRSVTRDYATAWQAVRRRFLAVTRSCDATLLALDN